MIRFSPLHRSLSLENIKLVYFPWLWNRSPDVRPVTAGDHRNEPVVHTGNIRASQTHGGPRCWEEKYCLFGLACLKERMVSQYNEDSSSWLGKISYYHLRGLFVPTNQASGTRAAKQMLIYQIPKQILGDLSTALNRSSDKVPFLQQQVCRKFLQSFIL